MTTIAYALPGNAAYIERLYPNPKTLNPSTGLGTYEQVIAYYTAISLRQDGIEIDGSPTVTCEENRYLVAFTPKAGLESSAAAFEQAHVAFLATQRAGQALTGAEACRAGGAWNPMAGFPVNASDGPCEWFPC